jgi:hypothetical protein
MEVSSRNHCTVAETTVTSIVVDDLNQQHTATQQPPIITVRVELFAQVRNEGRRSEPLYGRNDNSNFNRH